MCAHRTTAPAAASDEILMLPVGYSLLVLAMGCLCLKANAESHCCLGLGSCLRGRFRENGKNENLCSHMGKKTTVSSLSLTTCHQREITFVAWRQHRLRHGLVFLHSAK